MGRKKLTIEFIREQTEKNVGYKLLSDEYKNVKTKLKFQCPEGHIFWMRRGNFQRGQRCPVCSVELKKLTIEFIREQTEKTGYKMLSDEYKNAHTKLEFQCPEGHIFWMTWTSFQQGVRCPVCVAESTSSKAEIEIQKFVHSKISLFDNIIFNDRTQILNPKTGRYLELDIYLPSLMKAIEYNGTYWHGKPKAKKYDKFKLNECERLGIDLLVIHEQDYINNKERELQKITEFLKEI